MIRALLDPGDVAIDIGANVGWFVATAAPLVGASGRIHAFEPQPAIAAMLRETIALNRFDQVTLHETALSDRDGTVELHVLEGNAGAGRLDAPADEAGWCHVIVRTRDASAVFADLGLGRVRMVKIDVEGHEGTVLRACQPTFLRDPPDVVLFESNHEPEPFPERESVRALLESGFRLFQFAPPARRIRLVEVAPDGAGTGSANDFVALHEGPRLADDLRRLRVSPADLARPL